MFGSNKIVMGKILDSLICLLGLFIENFICFVVVLKMIFYLFEVFINLWCEMIGLMESLIIVILSLNLI